MTDESTTPLEGGTQTPPRLRPRVVGKITYRCHTCGELIDDGDVLFVNSDYAGATPPVPLTPDTTTHHSTH